MKALYIESTGPTIMEGEKLKLCLARTLKNKNEGLNWKKQPLLNQKTKI